MAAAGASVEEVNADEGGDKVFLDGSVRARWIERGRESWRPARDGGEVMVELIPHRSLGESHFDHDHATANDDADTIQLMFVLGEAEAEAEITKTFHESHSVRRVAEQIGAQSAIDFVQLVHECLRCMADGARVELSCQVGMANIDNGHEHIVPTESSAILELHLKSLEPAKWNLAPAAKLALAGRKRQLGNRHLQSGRLEIALVRYRDALGLVEFDDNFDNGEDEDEDVFPADTQPAEAPIVDEGVLLGCAWMSGSVRIEDVHAERERCLANLAAASLQTSEFSGALKYCERALVLNKDSAKVWFRKGRAEMALGDAMAAATSLSEAVRLAPKDGEAARALQAARAARQSENEDKRARERAFVQTSTEPAGVVVEAGGHASGNAAAGLWDGASEGERSARDTGSRDKSEKNMSDEDKAAQVEYNKRQLMYHFGKSKQKPEEDAGNG